MNTKLKYCLCILLSLLITAAVVFMPYIYFSAGGSEKAAQTTAESFTIPKPGDNTPSFHDIYKLLTDDSAIWINDNNCNFQNIIRLTEDSLRKLYWYFEDNEYTKSVMDDMISQSDGNPDLIEPLIVSGTVGDKSVYVSLAYLEYIHQGDNGGALSILINRDTGEVYELTYEFFYDSESKFDAVEYEVEIYTEKAVVNYFNGEADESVLTVFVDDLFGFYAFGSNYYELRYESSYDDSEVFDG